MMKRIITVCVLLTCLISLSSCGYNIIMYKHLSDPSNYEEYTATIVNVYFVDKDYEFRKTPKQAEHVLLEVRFNSKEELAPFYGVSAKSLKKDCSEYTVRFEVIAENHQVLYKSGFYDVVTPETEITLKASNWIYCDDKFFFVSSVYYGGVEYLDEDTGMQNIIDMMDDNRGL